MSGRRPGLGRGLDALFADSGALPPTAPRAVRELPVAQLEPNSRQPRDRFDDAELADLAGSIARRGVLQPLVVTGDPDGGGAYRIVAGERRWRAARKAGLETVPVVFREVASDRELLELALVENLQRADLNALEEAEAFRALGEEFGLSQQEIADRVGRSRAAVANSLRLLRLPDAVQERIRSGALTAGQARPLLSLGDEKNQVELAARAERESLSARELERIVSSGPRKKRAAAATAGESDPDTAHAVERLTRRLQTRVEISRRARGGGVLKIHFHSEPELIRLYERLSAE
ncbi:MAG: ParB/RepB/Spo0J family partition protein [Acidobacteriota bacterium]|nr:ParB/RepB/Spo0J family partition protein [Acidobacteriota bacterium]MDE2921945.1 ParB/RepB/Spo0J family partition protein [Acidobacteriota bacterium]MDE3265955.1 ParB/RepB/Spo0J family partition protein [Acidobacteriota bacterium]